MSSKIDGDDFNEGKQLKISWNPLQHHPNSVKIVDDDFVLMICSLNVMMILLEQGGDAAESGSKAAKDGGRRDPPASMGAGPAQVGNDSRPPNAPAGSCQQTHHRQKVQPLVSGLDLVS